METGASVLSPSGRWFLTWLSVAVITLMDELTSVFYAPAEAYRLIEGSHALIFIAFTSVFVHWMTTRLVEVAEILEHHGLIGGGVYSFSYLVLGPIVSFIAVASIMVDYVLTACLSAVSAIENLNFFFALGHSPKMALIMVIIWGVAFLNILGIKENARFTFMIFIAAAFVFLNLIASGVLAIDGGTLDRLQEAAVKARDSLKTGSFITSYGVFIASIASCVLAYSGVESVLQTAGLVRSWKDIGKAYIFLAITVGLVTPLVAALALSAPFSPEQYKQHEGDLITFYATYLNGPIFGVMVAALASFTLTMAVNTAFVASSELMERVAHRYGFHWLITTNRQQSLYRIHLCNALFFLGHHLHHRGAAGTTGQHVRPGPPGQLLHQHGLPHHLPLLQGHQGSDPFLHQPLGHPGHVGHFCELLYLSGPEKTGRHPDVGQRHRRGAAGRAPGGPETRPGKGGDHQGRPRNGHCPLSGSVRRP